MHPINPRSAQHTGKRKFKRKKFKTFRSAWGRARRKLVAFMCGLLLAFIYGVLALYIQKHALWDSIINTVTMAAFTAFGMGFSITVRQNITLMLPTLFSKEAKKILYFLIITLVVQGPFNNILENFDRAATSVLCGTEFAMNQSQELMQRAATPLLPVLEKVREVSRNAYSLAGRVQKLISTLTESVRHVARSLRNVLQFLASIGDICNAKMGTPYKKCNSVFDEGRADCMELLSVFSFLCHIVDGFRPLCGIARVGESFCIIPSYIGNHLKTNLAFPIIAAFDQMKKEFEFNMSASVQFDMNINSSQSLHDIVQKIREEVSEKQNLILNIKGLLTYGGLFLMLLMYLQAVFYKRNYLHVDDFDNFYITEQFESMDRMFTRQGKTAVLPLTKKEALTYITPYCWRLSTREKRAVINGLVSMFKHLMTGCVVIVLDLMVFWAFDILHYHAQQEMVVTAPVLIDVEVNGSGYASDIFRDILASFDILQRGNITILSKECLMQPLEPEYTVYLFIGLLYGFAFAMVISGGYAKRLQRLVCACYYPQREKVRVEQLHSRILSQRESLRKALLQVAATEKEKQQNGSVLRTLTLCLPGGVTIARLLGYGEKQCQACGKFLKVKTSFDVSTCSRQNSTECFCLECYIEMGRICGVCTASHSQDSDLGDYEQDSSDEEQGDLAGAMPLPPQANDEEADRTA